MEEQKIEHDKILMNTRKYITTIFIFQTVFFIMSLIALYMVNISKNILFPGELTVIINSSLFGFLGSIIFFSRKSYVYLITNKFFKILDDNFKKKNINAILNTIRGYYLYLIFRPLVGLVIGPILYMLAITGLITFMKTSVNIGTEISRSGRYLIYIISFLGGHASSDVLDYFSKIAKSIVIKNDKKISDEQINETQG